MTDPDAMLHLRALVRAEDAYLDAHRVGYDWNARRAQRRESQSRLKEAWTAARAFIDARPMPASAAVADDDEHDDTLGREIREAEQ